MLNIPLSLYIHFPWCVKKCPYCDFNSYALPGKKSYSDMARHVLSMKTNYINALIKDLNNELKNIPNRDFISIFLGGGTPSLFDPQEIARLLSQIPQKESIEITMESNPGTVDLEKLIGFKQAGINRLSIGVQSFQEEKLQKIGRIHSAKEALLAIESARNAGFENVNIDLMYGLPGQSISDALFDLNSAIQADPQHISWYQLTIEPATVFGKNPPVLPDEEIILEMEKRGRALLENAGYHRYEISAYAKPGFQCQHNLNYWQYGDYIGIGAGAHGKITSTQSNNNVCRSDTQVRPYDIIRGQKTKLPQDYLSGDFLSEIQTLPTEEIPLDFMINVARLVDGVPMNLFLERTGLPIETLQKHLEPAKKAGFLIDRNDMIRPTPLGVQFLDEIFYRI